MKLTKFKTSIDNFWNFEKAGDSICGKFIETTENVGDGDVVLLQTGKGVWGVNVYASMKQQVPKLERGEFYIFTFVGMAKSKKSDRDYYKVEVIKPEPEDQSDKDQLNSWYNSVTFERPVGEETEPAENSKVDNEAPF